MYTKHFGLAKKPFELNPDPTMVYMGESYKEAMAVLRYGLLDKKGFLLLTGPVGTGKTTLLKLLLKTLSKNIRICLVANPLLSISEFYYFLSAQYGLDEWDGNKAKFLLKFGRMVEECLRKDERVLLIIDEAHLLSEELLEEVRLLSNQEYQVLSIVLVGQPELADHLEQDRFLPFRQRIGLRFNLKPFLDKETGYYIKLRLLRSGAQRLDLFNEDAIKVIHHASKGIPRTINVLCDLALLSGLAEKKHIVNEEMVRECVKEMQLAGEDIPLLPKSKSSFLCKFMGRRERQGF